MRWEVGLQPIGIVLAAWGLQVLQAIKLLRDEGAVTGCRYVYCNRNPSGRARSLLLPVKLETPSARCASVVASM